METLKTTACVVLFALSAALKWGLVLAVGLGVGFVVFGPKEKPAAPVSKPAPVVAATPATPVDPELAQIASDLNSRVEKILDRYGDLKRPIDATSVDETLNLQVRWWKRQDELDEAERVAEQKRKEWSRRKELESIASGFLLRKFKPSPDGKLTVDQELALERALKKLDEKSATPAPPAPLDGR